MQSFFRSISSQVSRLAGNPITFVTAVVLIIVWAVSGPYFNFSDTWQLVINTTTTIITFLMVFLIQNTQNRDSLAMQIKLDELIRSAKGARNNIVNIEEGEDDQLHKLHEEFRKLQERADKLEQRVEAHHSKSSK